mmetsp:Transcript_2055/g.2965  ORF Transcript_2055/g.2965 Transcript_2055/m.2965 type:complete len:97 (-) Transcript_2055:259-549(-)
MRLNIDLIGQNQQRRGTDASVVQQFVQLLLCRGQLLRSRGVYYVEDDVAALAVAGPLGSVLGLAANVPAFHVDVSLFEDFDVEADGWDCFYWLSVC